MSYWVWPAGSGPGEAPVGDALDVGVEDRVGPEAGGEDVGVGLGDLERLGARGRGCARTSRSIAWSSVRPSGGPSSSRGVGRASDPKGDVGLTGSRGAGRSAARTGGRRPLDGEAGLGTGGRVGETAALASPAGPLEARARLARPGLPPSGFARQPGAGPSRDSRLSEGWGGGIAPTPCDRADEVIIRPKATAAIATRAVGLA